MQQSWTISYNTYYLDADNRGCNSCHADMNAMIENMEYKHATIDNKALETYSDVNQCISCHRDNGDDFGRLIHAIHYNERSGNKFAEGSNGTCQSCHDATADGNGMQLWDNVKHEALQGINKVENVQGEFASTQDKVQTQDELYSYDFVHGYYDHMRYACGPNGLDIDLPQSMFDEWEFTVDGNVNAPYTKKLPELVADGKIRAGVLLGVNSMMWPQTPEYQRAIKDMEFTVAIDYYMRPWTHDLVDMLLPAAMCYERMAPPAIFGRKIFHRDPVVKPMGQCREDWQIILEIGCALGFEEECYGGSVEAALDDMYRGAGIDISLELLREHPEGYEVPGGSKDEKKYETGGLRKDGQPGFNTPTGKIELVSEILKQYGFEGLPVYEEPVHSPVSTPDEAKDYSLVLNSGSRVPYYTHSKLRDLPWLNQFMPDPVVRLHPDDAEARGITDGAQVRVFNQFGEVTMKAEITNLVLPGVVDVFHGWHQADINLLTTRDFDPITGFPPFRSGLCEVESTGKGKITV